MFRASSLPIIPVLFCYKTLHVSGIFSAHYPNFVLLQNSTCFGHLLCPLSQFYSVTKLYMFRASSLPIIPILFCYKILHVSGIFSAHYPSFILLQNSTCFGHLLCPLSQFYSVIKLYMFRASSLPIIPVLFCYKTLHVSGIFSAHYPNFVLLQNSTCFGHLPCPLSQFYSVTKLYMFRASSLPIIPILFCYKTLHVSGIFPAHHQELFTVHSALVSFMQVSDDRFQAESGWKRSSENCMKLTSAECTVESS